MKPGKFYVQDIHDLNGKTISAVYHLRMWWVRMNCDVTAPADNMLCNFEVETQKLRFGDVEVSLEEQAKLKIMGAAKGLKLFVLDPYGKGDGPGYVPRKFEKCLFGKHSYTFAVEMRTGQIYQVQFAKQIYPENPGLANSGEENVLVIDDQPFMSGAKLPKVPEPFLSHVDNLGHEKRPFSIGLDEWFLAEYIEREAGKKDLAAAFFLRLQWPHAALKLETVDTSMEERERDDRSRLEIYRGVEDAKLLDLEKALA